VGPIDKEQYAKIERKSKNGTRTVAVGVTLTFLGNNIKSGHPDAEENGGREFKILTRGGGQNSIVGRN